MRPWQVDHACKGATESQIESSVETIPAPHDETGKFHDLYYNYLSLLLHPTDGHGAARHDKDLVQEWCELSIKGMTTDRKPSDAATRFRRSNFFSVASRTSSDHLAFHRDKPMLLNLSMQIREHDLALDLCE